MAAALHVRPPNPSRQGHCPVNCRGEHCEGAPPQASPCPGVGAWVCLHSGCAPKTRAPIQRRARKSKPRMAPQKAQSHPGRDIWWRPQGERGQKEPSLRAAWRETEGGEQTDFPRRDPGGHPLLYLVALGAEGTLRVTGTGLTAPTTGQLPVVGSALVTFGAHHVGQTQALPTLLVARHVPTRPQDAAVTACRGRVTQLARQPKRTPGGHTAGSGSAWEKNQAASFFPDNLADSRGHGAFLPGTWQLGRPPSFPLADSVPPSNPGLCCHLLDTQGTAPGTQPREVSQEPGGPHHLPQAGAPDSRWQPCGLA